MLVFPCVESDPGGYSSPQPVNRRSKKGPHLSQVGSKGADEKDALSGYLPSGLATCAQVL